MKNPPKEHLSNVAGDNRNALATLGRWDEWACSAQISWRRVCLLGWHVGYWVGDWRGPRGGRYSYTGLTRGSVRRRIRHELARWTRKRNRRITY